MVLDRRVLDRVKAMPTGSIDDEEGGDDEQPVPRICVDCRTASPPVATAYTLIGARYGWRLTQREGADGLPVAEWRCASCWAAKKGRARE